MLGFESVRKEGQLQIGVADESLSSFIKLVGSAHAASLPEEGRRNLSRSRIPFADPSAWFVAGVVKTLIDQLSEVGREQIGTILIDPIGPREVIRDLRVLRKEKTTSPMRFAAATPSSLLAVSCILYGLRGPSLVLLCSAREGIVVAAHTAHQWMLEGSANAVLLVSRPSFESARAVALTTTSDATAQVRRKSMSDFLCGRGLQAT